MVGLVDYASGSESESDTVPQKNVDSVPKPTPVAQPKRPAKKKIGIALPALSSKPTLEEDDNSGENIDDRPAKKPRTGSGKSSLLGMLPAPKSNSSVTAPKERVLGGGGGPGLVFKAGSSSSQPPKPFTNPYATTVEDVEDEGEDSTPAPTPAPSESSSSKPFLLPPSLQKRRPNVSLEETSVNTPKPVAPPPKPSAPAVDFFSLGSTKSSGPNLPSTSTKPSIPSVSAAPALPEFKVPEPTPYDPYPGYYQLPSGQWAQHDVEYFSKFQKKWQAEYDAHVRALENGTVKGFEGYDASLAQEIDPVEEMERARKEVQEREQRKALTKGASGEPAQPKMKITAAKMSGVARSRHQLATMLKEAYDNREALEEKIAEGKRNRKEAGNKYGF